MTLSVAAGARLIIVGGGDGTLSSAANALAFRGVALGVLPLGTANDFARGLGVPRALEAAADVIATGAPKAVDLGLAGDRFFLNAASVGLTSAIAARMDPELKKQMGKLAYPVTAVSEAWNQEPFRAVLRAGARKLDVRALQVVVANGRFHGGGRVTHPAMMLDDARLGVYAIAAGEPGQDGAPTPLERVWTLARVGMLLRRGRHLAHPAVEHFRTSGLTLQTDPPLPVNLDGELWGTTPVTFGIAPGALRVLVPKPVDPAAH